MDSITFQRTQPNRLRCNSTSHWRKLGFLIALACLISLPQATKAADKRQKVIDFEDELVEGVNRRPLDSLSTLSDAEKRKRKPHLYRKRRGFRAENDETLKVLRYVP